MKEYGSNIQKLVDYIITLPDRETRTKQAHILIELMRQIHPQMRDGIDYSKKLWDDLYIMANFDLDVDSPFPPPPKEILGRKPMQVPYTQRKLAYLYYGRHVELLVLKALVTENVDERRAFISYIVKLMKSLYLTWNKDTVETETCLQSILELSAYKLQDDVNYLREHGIIEEASPKDGQSHQSSGQRFRPNFDNQPSGGGGNFQPRKPNQKNFQKRPNQPGGGQGGGQHPNQHNKNRPFNKHKRRPPSGV